MVLCLLALLRSAAAEPLTDDAWDVSRGSTIVTNSPGDWKSASDPRDLFGGEATRGVEMGRLVFADGMPDDFVHFVEWRTPQAMALTGIRLFAAGDGPVYFNEREFRQFTLKARNPTSGAFEKVLTFTPTHPYTFLDTNTSLVLETNFPTVVAGEFRAEFVQYTAGRGYDGPRIVELDAITAALKDPQNLFDISRGIQITDHTALNAIAATDIANMFGATNAVRVETGVVFADGAPEGFVHSVEWQTRTPIRLEEIRLFAAGDGSEYRNEREFTRFTLLARLPGSTNFSPIVVFAPAHPYAFMDTNTLLMLDTNFPAITARQFRAEFVNYVAGRGYDGPRIQALQGFGAVDDGIPDAWRREYFGSFYRMDPRAAAGADPDGDGATNLDEYLDSTDPTDPDSVLEITQIRMLPSITWRSVPGLTYQVYRKTAANPQFWEALLPLVKATNDLSSFIDPQPAPAESYYQIQRVR